MAGDIYSVVTIALANGHGDTGALVLFNYANLVFTSVCSVLPIAIVTSAFPVLSATDGEEFDRTSAGSTRAVMLMSWLGTAVIAAVAVPAAHILAKEPDQVTQLAQAFLLFAPGVAGFAVITNMSRVLFALGKLKAAGIGLVAGPLLQAVLSVPLVAAGTAAAGRRARSRSPARWPARGGGPDGDRDQAAARAGRRRRRRPRDAGRPRGRRRRARGGLASTWSAGRREDARGRRGVLAAALAVLVFGLVAYALDRGDLRAVAAARRLRRLARLGQTAALRAELRNVLDNGRREPAGRGDPAGGRE